MTKWKFYHNPQCSKSREALEFLNSQNLNFEIIEYLKKPLSRDELMELIQQLDTSPASLVRVKENDFLQAPFDVSSAEEVAQNLAKNPRLMERPVLQRKGAATIGRPLEKFEALLKD